MLRYVDYFPLSLSFSLSITSPRGRSPRLCQFVDFSFTRPFGTELIDIHTVATKVFSSTLTHTHTQAYTYIERQL